MQDKIHEVIVCTAVYIVDTLFTNRQDSRNEGRVANKQETVSIVMHGRLLFITLFFRLNASSVCIVFMSCARYAYGILTIYVSTKSFEILRRITNIIVKPRRATHY